MLGGRGGVVHGGRLGFHDVGRGSSRGGGRNMNWFEPEMETHTTSYDYIFLRSLHDVTELQSCLMVIGTRIMIN
jgi:hypothetical protein